LWLKENPFNEKFYGLIDSPVHWVFNKGNYISTVTSNSDELNDFSQEQIMEYFTKEIEEFFPLKISDKIINSKIIKEKRATFIPDNKTEKVRDSNKSPFNNFIISGDFSDTKLPSTIEGAVKSGRTTADLIINGK